MEYRDMDSCNLLSDIERQMHGCNQKDCVVCRENVKKIEEIAARLGINDYRSVIANRNRK